MSVYHFVHWLLGLGLGFYFRRVERFNAERVPRTGPVLITSNHPSSLADSFVIGASVPRKVNFVATVQLFRKKPVSWLLTRCGVVPINRQSDDPKGMRSVMDSFESCFRVLEAGEAIVIFPEGITHDDPQLKEVKSGAARMALELEHRHKGRLGLQIVPVGLTYSAKELYRSDVLVNFGEPIAVAPYITNYEEQRKQCIRELTREIEQRIQALMLHLPQLERARVVQGVKRLYYDRLRLGNVVIREPVSPTAEELLLTRTIAEAVDYVFDTYPERAAQFVRKLNTYERWIDKLHLSEDALRNYSRPASFATRSAGWALLAVIGAPVAFYGWIHRLIPLAIIRHVLAKTDPAKRKPQTAHATILGGIIGFGVFYPMYVAMFHYFFGWPASLWYAASLPVAGLITHFYFRNLRRLISSLHNTAILLRAPVAARRLLAMRNELIAEIEALRPEAREHMETIGIAHT